MFYYGISDIGRKRNSNQDCYCITEPDGALLCTVCDGMGGVKGGNIASNLAIRAYTDFIQDAFQGKLATSDHVNVRDILSKAVDAANTAVRQRAEEDPELNGMGTTLVSALLLGSLLYTVNVGDSRLYTVTEREIRQVTKDHSYVQYLIDLGKITREEAAKAPMRNIITRSVGNEPTPRADIFVSERRGSGYLLLCSDGLTGFVSEEQIADTVTGRYDESGDTPFHDRETGQQALETRGKRLIALANEAGGGDNITAVLVRY